MQESDINTEIIESEGQTSFFNEINRIKRSESPLLILSLFLSQFSQPTDCFIPSNISHIFDKSISIILYNIKPTILTEAVQLISFLDFQLSLGYQLKSSDYFLLYKVISIYPSIINQLIPIVSSSQHPIQFFSIFILNQNFNQSVFHYQLNQSYTESPEILNRILEFITKNKFPLNENLYNNFLRVFPPSKLKEELKDIDIVSAQAPLKYTEKNRSINLALSNSIIFDRTSDISEDNKSVSLLNSQSFTIKNHLKKQRPDGNYFFVDANPSSNDVYTKSCRIDKNENSDVSIKPQKGLNKDIIIYFAAFIVLGISAFFCWKHVRFV